MKQQWTVDYRNWIGSSTKGLIFLRARQGAGKWRNGHDVPPHVVAYLRLEQVGLQWVLQGVTEKSMEEGGKVTFAKRIPGRVYCRIEAPKVEPQTKAYAPASVRRALGSGYDSPWQLYRAYYKYTDCGPSLGMWIEGKDRGIYCHNLPGSWDAVKGRITAFTVGSIVEGVDQECQSIDVPCSPLATLKDRLDAAVTEVNEEADHIWNLTHGCPKCGPEIGGCRPINPKCKACKGEGVIL